MSFLLGAFIDVSVQWSLDSERRLPPQNFLALLVSSFPAPAHPLTSFAIQMPIFSVRHRSKFLSFFLLVCLFFLQKFRCESNTSTGKEQTLAIIKPDGLFNNYTDKIKNVILDSGFTICKEMTLQLDEDGVGTFYVEHSLKSFFHSLITYMTSGPVLVMVLEKENAVADWRALIGPTDSRKAKITHPHSLRAMCGIDSEKNCVHGSDSPQSAQREISFFFKEMSAGSSVMEHDEL